MIFFILGSDKIRRSIRFASRAYRIIDGKCNKSIKASTIKR
jgi:hypothetical protein